MEFDIKGVSARILFEDDDVLAFVKPAGVLSQGVPSGEKSVLEYIAESAQGKFVPHAVHRLDRNTGGVMLCAKNAKAAAALSGLFADGAVHKEYLAAASGTLDGKATLEHELYFDRSKNKAYAVRATSSRRGVKHAVLDYEAMSHLAEPERTVLRVRLHTGRTHQIRCQLAAVGHPLVGDRRYGGRGTCDCSLWSYKISFEARALAATPLANGEFAKMISRGEELICLPSGFPWE